MKNNVLNYLVLAILFVCLSPGISHAQATSFRIHGASNTYLMGINDYLNAAGYYTNAQGTFGFVYAQPDTILVAYPGAVNTFLYDVNNSGIAVGAYNMGSNTGNVGFSYNIYTHVFTVSTAWLTGYQQVIPYKINNVGDVVGSYHLSTNNWMFLMLGSLNVGSLHYNYKPTYGVGININDDVVGFYIDGGIYHGVIRSISGTLTSFDYPGAFKTKAYGINDSLKIVGEFNTTRGFVYKTTSPASFQEIVIPGVSEIHPYDINNNGYIAGYFLDSTGSMAGFILTDRFSGELHFSDKTVTTEALGVAADGTAAITLRVKRTYGTSTINSIKIKLEEPNNNLYNPIGKIGTSAANADTNFITVNNPSGTDHWDFYYLSPKVFSYQSTSGFYREIKAKITLHNNASNTDYYCEKIIRIIRVPVLLVHGLISEGAAFQDCANYLIATGKYTPETAFPVDYKPSNQVAFTRNSYVFPTNIRMGKVRCQKIGYEVKKFDIVGHSMGAVLARLYLQGPDYKDDFNRLITVNSPLSGSQGANVLSGLPMYVRHKIGIDGQAFDDLCVTSDAIRQLLNGPLRNHRLVPSYAITSTANSVLPVFTTTVLGAAMYMAYRLFLPTTSLAIDLVVPLMFNGPSDLVVAENSQIAGCSAYMQIANEWHSGICSNSTAKLAISNLLEEPASSPVFSTTGFNPPTLLWLGQKNQPNPLNVSDSVHFVQPLAGTVKTNGDTLNIHLTGTSGINRMMLYIKKSADSVFFLDTLTNNLNYQYVVPALSCGIVPMYVFAIDAAGNFLSDSTFIIVQPVANPDSLFISSPADSLMLPVGLEGSISVSCHYSDNIVRDVTLLPGVQYQFLTNKAAYLGGGIVKGLQAGNDVVTATFAGLSASLPVHIDAYYPKVDTIVTAADICSDSTYNFYGTLLNSSGTYYASYLNQYGNDSTIVLNLNVTNCSPNAVLSGTLNYDNTSGTPMNGVAIILKQGVVVVKTDTTSQNGNFSFGGLAHGKYEISVSANTPWGGVNSADALKITQHFVGIITLSGIRKKAADVNGISGINSADALVDMRRFVGINSSFTVGDWVWSSSSDTLTVNADTTYLIKGICYGDVNGSYNPSLKTRASVILSAEGTMPFIPGSTVAVPFLAKTPCRLSSVSLILKFHPEETEIAEITPMSLSSDEVNSYFITNVSGDELRIAWFSLFPVSLQGGETLFTVNLKTKNTESSLFGVSPESLFTDETVQDISRAEITYPKLVLQASGFLFNCCTPNPMRDVTDIQYYTPSQGKIQIFLYDVLGNKTELFPLTTVSEGMHSVTFNAAQLRPGGFGNGVYWMLAGFNDGSNRVVKTSKVVITR